MPETTYYLTRHEERLAYGRDYYQQHRDERLAYAHEKAHPCGITLFHCGQAHPVRALPWTCPRCDWTFTQQEGHTS